MQKDVNKHHFYPQISSSQILYSEKATVFC